MGDRAKRTQDDYSMATLWREDLCVKSRSDSNEENE